MNDAPQNELPDLPQARVEARSRLSPSLVWLVPLAVLLIGGWLAINALMSRGPTVTLQFATGQGIEAGKTRIKYRAVDIGAVTAVSLSPDRSHILLTARLVKEAAPYLVEDSRFWVVRPRINGGNVTGLDTLLAGAYIALDAGKSSQAREHFIGLDEAPIVTGDRPGRQFTLLSEDLGSLEIGSPVYYRRVPVGQVIGFRLTPNGRNVAVSVFINQPYDRFVVANSRFWHASGVDLTIDAAGLKVNTQSLLALALGGVAFDSSLARKDAAEAASSQPFTLFNNREQAMRRLETAVASYIVQVHDSVRGLSVGAPVDFRGMAIGEVTGLALDVGKDISQPLIDVKINIYPERLYALAGGPHTRKALRALSMEQLVAKGLRAQLRSANLITGQLYLALDYYPAAPKAQLGSLQGVDVLPSVPSDMAELQQSFARIVKSIDQMQLDQLAHAMRGSLQTLNRTLQQTGQLVDGVNQQGLPQMLATLKSLQQTLDTARQTVRPDSPLQQDLRTAAQQVTAAARSLQTLSDTLSRNPESLLRGRPGESK